ncbi:GH15 family glucan-1,4-alpha-glucosidase [Paucimonas lemoignei]|uniref:GH15 family glucan-1,4-alpha-glucosidase n=1 Tax=Paucimonas lemoignei TaxID=29443 RepID=A0A4R3I5U3_PAULE|nr:glycoside hydrolase family 15 protein [Paucimonas lemoignei]TCS39379.1 GH15 family glucan-1,4-alpha-glucosidase [Paucimonas lemoignei]
MTRQDRRYPSIADYAFISDCHCTALVSRNGSIDWCCMPRPDSDSCFGRILDWDHGGYCAIAPTTADVSTSRRYIPESMIVETCFRSTAGEVKVVDFFVMDKRAEEQAPNRLVRMIEGIRGELEILSEIVPRFDFGQIIPAVSEQGDGTWMAIGSNQGLVLHSDLPLEIVKHFGLRAAVSIKRGQKKSFIFSFLPPDQADRVPPQPNVTEVAMAGYRSTVSWWRDWVQRMHPPYKLDEATKRSAMVLKALTFERTGAIIAAPTTSLPEWIGAGRNWDYRYSWVRDSVFTVYTLNGLGYADEAERFLQFIQRSSAGSAEQLQIMYAVDGKRRLTEVELPWLEGYRRSQPVRIGNFAAKQHQLDVYGEILELASIWNAAGNEVDLRYWEFLTDVVNGACRHWAEPDYGIWEFRGEPRHHVHSKAMCWRAVKQGIAIAEGCGLPAPLDDWQSTCDQIRQAIDSQGYDRESGTFVQAFGNTHLDSSLLLLPRIGFVEYDDPRMLRTVDAICMKLNRGGLLLRYDSPDGLPGKEGSFIPCTFWLVSCLAYQGRLKEAWEYYRLAARCSNDLGLFSEEYDASSATMLGNFPQGLTHISQIRARLALEGNGDLLRHGISKNDKTL